MRGKLLLVLLLASLCSVFIVCDREDPVEPLADLPESLAPGFYLGPIEGLTTTWHPVPQNLALPRGYVAQFRLVAPEGTVATWSGAREVEARFGVSTATCPLDQSGPMEVRVEAAFPGGRTHTRVCRFTVVDVAVGDIAVREVLFSAPQPHFDTHSKGGKDPGALGTSVNDLTMKYFFGDESIAALRQTGPNTFLTSAQRTVRMSIEVDPPALASLMEWRVNGRAAGLGETATKYLANRGTYQVSVGPLRRAYRADIEAYEVEITSHVTGRSRIEDGWSVVVSAKTIPSGYEGYVTWMASTKHGASDPIMGTGRDFVVTFDGTWGSDAETGRWTQWLGVRADNAVFNQDQKLCAAPVPACSPSHIPDPPFDVSASPVTWPFSNGTFEWDIPLGDSPTIAGPFTVTQNAVVIQTGFISVTANEPGCGVSVSLTLTENGNTLTQSMTATIPFPGASADRVDMVGTLNGLPYSFSYNFVTGVLSNWAEDPGIPAVVAPFDLDQFTEMAQVALADVAPAGMAVCEHAAVANVANGWGFWSMLASCASTGGVAGWCISALINGVGASCCSPAVLALAVVYIKCLEDL